MQLLAAASPGALAGAGPAPARAGAAARTAAAARAPAPAAPPPAADAPVEQPRAGLRSWNGPLNQRLADAQQTLDFLDGAQARLQDLRSGLADGLAGRSGGSAPLAARLREFGDAWRQRQKATGGSLGPQLDYSSPRPAAQRFSVRGLDARSLQRSEPETLSFSVAGGGAQPVSVKIDPGQPADALARRFDDALAAAQIRVEADADGGLQFSTPESNWPAVRDSLAVKGGGKRFPSGAFHRVRTDAEPEAIRPEGWSAADLDSVRGTLKQVLGALDRVRVAKGTVGRELASAGRDLQDAAPADGAEWASRFAAAFDALAREPGFEAHASIGKALTGVRRDRVLALLGLR